MGRKKSIDRDALLDAAETIVLTQGASALTIDAVAKAAGITKGGVQYTFASKDALIEAMMARWDVQYEEVFQSIVGSDRSPVGAVYAHAEATARSSDSENARSAALMAAMIQSPEHLTKVREWYAARVEGLDTTTPEGKRARLAFLATEGAFSLRFFGFKEITAEEWQEIFADIKTILKEE